MANHTKEQEYFIEDLENKSQELIHIMFILCEKRAHAAPMFESPLSKAMAEAAMAVKYAIRAFIAVEHLQGK